MDFQNEGIYISPASIFGDFFGEQYIHLPYEGEFKQRIKITQNKSESSFVDPVNFSARSLSTEHPGER